MGLNGYLLLLRDFKEWIFYKREGKDNLLMYDFPPYFLFFLFTSLFPFSLLFHYQFSLFSSLGCYLLPFTTTVPIYTGLIPQDFSLLPLWLTNHFFFAMNRSLQLSINPLVARSQLYLGMPNMFSLFHYPIPWQAPIFLVLTWAFPPCLNK